MLLLERFGDILQWRITTDDKLLSLTYSCQCRAGHFESIKRNRIHEVDTVIVRASAEDRDATQNHMSNGSILGINQRTVHELLSIDINCFNLWKVPVGPA